MITHKGLLHPLTTSAWISRNSSMTARPNHELLSRVSDPHTRLTRQRRRTKHRCTRTDPPVQHGREETVHRPYRPYNAHRQTGEYSVRSREPVG
jgi:hypothetical protein